MKKFLFSLLISIIAVPVFAEGYQVNSQSAKQTGMGHVGVAMKLGAESMHFNPAGLVFLNSSVDLSVGVSAIKATAKYKSPDGSYSAKTDNPFSTPVYAYAAFKIYDNFAAGISLTTPYGSSLKWPKNWEGANLIQDISLKSYVLQPTFSYKITSRLSIGAGLMMAIGDMNLSRGLMSANDFQSFAGLVPSLPIPDEQKAQLTELIRSTAGVVPASARLDGKANLRVGFNVGAMYDITDQVTIGLSYRSKIKMKVKEGDAELTYASSGVEGLFNELNKYSPKPIIPPLDQGTFRAELPLPSNTTLGVSYRPNDRWELGFDVQYVGWKAYDSLNIVFNEKALKIEDIKAEKNYKNSMIYRVGAQYAATERLDVRAGVYFDQTPIRERLYNPETPGMNKLGFSAGLSFEPYKNLQIDFAFLYIQGLGADGEYPYKNVLGQDQVFSGKYESTALSASLGLAYRF